ncbi:hypothetical protein SAMN05443550_103256 [Pedobacter hartonius]|uniref:Short chain dehydrogenase n=1 Tax=Pedobacter hartonius TaxID=425514 RepID=A0A1H4B9C4_9SPHI|nr:hypothetical protein SAMN05443550_103256 [Pedobacter hartonius]
MKLKDKVTVITSDNSRIGFGIAEAFKSRNVMYLCWTESCSNICKKDT